MAYNISSPVTEWERREFFKGTWLVKFRGNRGGHSGGGSREMIPVPCSATLQAHQLAMLLLHTCRLQTLLHMLHVLTIVLTFNYA